MTTINFKLTLQLGDPRAVSERLPFQDINVCQATLVLPSSKNSPLYQITPTCLLVNFNGSNVSPASSLITSLVLGAGDQRVLASQAGEGISKINVVLIAAPGKVSFASSGTKPSFIGVDCVGCSALL